MVQVFRSQFVTVKIPPAQTNDTEGVKKTPGTDLNRINTTYVKAH